MISSVGHETDTTIADLVADQRAATPTAAAELATPVLTDTLLAIQDSQNRLANAMQNRIAFAKKELAKQTQSYIFQQPTRLYENYAQKVDQLTQQLIQLQQNMFVNRKAQLQQLTSRLAATSPRHQISQQKQLVDQLAKQLRTNALADYQRRQEKLTSLVRQLDSLSPLKIMGRGYTYVTKDQRVVNHAGQLAVGQSVQLHFKDGQAMAKITKIKEQK